MPIAYSTDALVYDGGTNSWSLRPDFDPNQHRVDVSITDSDGYLDGDDGADEVGYDATQDAIVTDMDGNPIASGQIYAEQFFAVWDGVNTHIYIEAVEIGGVPVGYIVSGPLSLGTSYSQSTSGNVDETTAAEYSSFVDVPCFGPGTMIDTPDGPQTVESLRPGDLILTLDHGPQPIRWIHHDAQEIEGIKGDVNPVLINSGALGAGLPQQDTVVSPQHRILVGANKQLENEFSQEALAPAKSLVSLKGIRHMAGKREITWFHFACDRHEIVFANGCLSESLLLGPMVVKGQSRAKRRELHSIFGFSSDPHAALNGPPVRDCLTVGAVRRQLKVRQNQKIYHLEKELRKWDVDRADDQSDAQPKNRAPSKIPRVS